MFTNDLVKIMYIDLGYLPNYPYHMITDAEMIGAFIEEGNYFDTFYYCPDSSLQEAYSELRSSIECKLTSYLNGDIDAIPDWIYSYMLGNTTTYSSDAEDISYLYDLTGEEPLISYDTFDKQLAEKCLSISTEWLKKQSAKTYDRVPTMFGEPHVIKSLRLASSDILTNG